MQQGQLIARGENTWLCRVYLGRGASGKREYLNHTVHGNKKAAQKWITKTQNDRNEGVAVKHAARTVNTYLDQWLEAGKRKVKAKTFDSYRDILRLHIRPVIGHRPLNKITDLDIQSVYNSMSDAGLSPRTVRYTNMILKRAFKKAVKSRMLTFNPCVDVELPRDVKREMTVFSPDQVYRFLSVAKLRESTWGALFTTAVLTGMRPSEYLALKWPDIDLDRRVLSVKRSIDMAKDGTWSFSDNKTPQSRRTIKLYSDVVEALRKRRAAQEVIRRKAQNWAEPELVFTTRVGTPIERNNIKRAFRALIAKVNAGTEEQGRKLPVIRLYDLRHTAATLALVAGTHPKVVAEMLGHASIKLTLDLYSHVLPHMQSEAVERGEKLLQSFAEPNRHTDGTQMSQPSESRLAN